jgi:hypothetical protein
MLFHFSFHFLLNRSLNIISCMVCSILFLAYDKGAPLSYLHEKKIWCWYKQRIMPVWIIVRILRTMSVFSMIVLLWIIFSGNNIGMNNNSCAWCHDYKSTQISKFNLDVWVVNGFFFLFWGPQNIIDIFQGHETDPHGWILLCTKMSLYIRQYTTWAYNDKLQSLAYYFDPHYEEQTLLLCVFQRPR